MACYNPNCCEETNPNCCEICNCLDFTSSNNTLDIQKTGCKTDIRITNNILDGLMSIPSSSCITIVKEYIDGKLVFTPTLNLQCIQNLIPTIPIIPDVPVYTANNGITLSNYNIELGGGDAKPLLDDTLISLGLPTAPKSLKLYQKDSTGSVNVVEDFIGTTGTKNTHTTTIKDGIADTSNVTVITQDANDINAVVSTVRNRVTDVAFAAPAYFNLGSTSVFGANYPITLNNISNAAPTIDNEHAAYCKVSDANLTLAAKNLLITSGSNISSTLELAVPNGYFILGATNNVASAAINIYPIDIINDPSTIIDITSGSTLIESNMYNDRLNGAYYAQGQLFTSKAYSLVGSVIPNTSSSSISAPVINTDTTSFLKTTSGNIEVYGKTITIHSDNQTASDINLISPSGAVILSSRNGVGSLLQSLTAIDQANSNSSLAYFTPGLIDFETFFGTQRDTGAFYASTIISSDARTATNPSSRIGVYCPNVTGSQYTIPPNDPTRTAYTVYTKATASTIAKEILHSGKVRITDVTNTQDTGSTTPCAALEVASNTGGVLLPRMSSSSRLAIQSPLAGLQVFDIEFNAVMTYDGTRWTGFRYNATTIKFEGYNGSTWLPLN